MCSADRNSSALLRMGMLLCCASLLTSCLKTTGSSPPSQSAEIEVSQSSAATLESPAPLPEEPELTRQIQAALRDLGYDPGPIDGILGQRTSAAIKAYQSDHGLDENGTISEILYRRLYPPSQNVADPDTAEETTDPTVTSAVPGYTLVTAGLEPVGKVSAPGCVGIEIVGYSQKFIIPPDALYYVAIRNNGDVTRIVELDIVGGRAITGRVREVRLSPHVPPKDIYVVELDYSSKPPTKVQVIRCL